MSSTKEHALETLNEYEETVKKYAVLHQNAVRDFTRVQYFLSFLPLFCCVLACFCVNRDFAQGALVFLVMGIILNLLTMFVNLNQHVQSHKNALHVYEQLKIRIKNTKNDLTLYEKNIDNIKEQIKNHHDSIHKTTHISYLLNVRVSVDNKKNKKHAIKLAEYTDENKLGV